MGTSAFGEIKRLAEIAQPTIGVITNIGYTHLESFVNLEGVLAEKKALLDMLPEDGCAVLNVDDLHLSKIVTRLHCDVVTFGLYKGAHVYAENIKLWPDKPSFELNMQGKTVKILMPVYGRFNIFNALAAAAAASCLEIDIETIKQGLEHFTQPKMRMETHVLNGGALLINDAYNANPSSIKESIQGMVTAFPERPKIVVLGDMLELGNDAELYHAKLGEFLASQPLEKIFLYGPLMKVAASRLEPVTVQHFSKLDSLEIELKNALTPDVVVLFKGSRGMHLEELFRHLTGE
jgi:UDP-N-acetylmuramoyl-tripeptide--D-alanyl-D-alanine ligase